MPRQPISPGRPGGNRPGRRKDWRARARSARLAANAAARIKIALPALDRNRLPLPAIPHVARRCVGTNAAEQIGNRFGITHGAKECLNPCAGDRRKEILQVHPQDNALAHVRGDECPDGPPFQEPMRGGMGRNPFQNFGPESAVAIPSTAAWALQSIECRRMPSPRSGSGSGAAADDPSQRPESFEIGEPLQFTVTQLKANRPTPRRIQWPEHPTLRPPRRAAFAAAREAIAPPPIRGSISTGRARNPSLQARTEPRRDAGDECESHRFDIAPGNGPKPAPGPAERAAGAGNHLLDSGFTGEKGSGQCTDKRPVRHGRRRRNAPTSLTLREPFCAWRSRRSRDEISVLHDPLG